LNLNLSKYKNIDKSSLEIYGEKDKFSLMYLKNNSDIISYNKYLLKENCIQLYFGLGKRSSVAFNMEHCAVHLSAEENYLVYFKEKDMNLLFTLAPKAEILVMLISVTHFHYLFAKEKNLFFNFNALKESRPIIEEKATSPVLKTILNQIISRKNRGSLEHLYLKGKTYELLSLYFNNMEESESEHCPFMANEETIAQIKQVKEIIIDQLAHPPSLEELSKTVGLNIKKLKTGFKEFYGTPVFTFLLNYKLELSKKYLKENKLNVSEIALLIGYSTSSHFIAAFKKKYGITPKQYTKQNTN